ncbi:MAG: hypothetical protein AAB690_00525 [Patescibacteria group bacterium]
MKKSQYNQALIFAGLPISDEEKFRVGEEIKKLGGLTFSVHINKDGWYAQCNQVDGIMAANTNPGPTNAEIEAEIRQAIISAFNIESSESSVESPFKFGYSAEPALN